MQSGLADDSQGDSSAPPSPITATSVVPYTFNGVMMTMTSLRNELVAFGHKYRRQGITLPLAAAFFVHHLDSSRMPIFNKLFDELFEQDGNAYRLISFPNIKSSPDTDDDHQETDTDNEVGNRQLRDDLMTVLQSSKQGFLRATIHQKMSVMFGHHSTVEIDKVLDKIADEKKRTFFLKPAHLRSRSKPSTPTPSTKSQPSQSPKPSKSAAVAPAPQTTPPPVQTPAALASQTTPPPAQDSDSSKWSPKTFRRLKQKTVDEEDADQIPVDQDLIARIVDIQGPKNAELYKVSFEKLTGRKKRAMEWISRTTFVKFDAWKDEIDIIRRWKASGLSKVQYLKMNPADQVFFDKKKLLTADGDGWCSFRAVGVALEKLVGRNPVTTPMIETFQEAGLKRGGREETKHGTRWKEVASFIRQVCSKKVGHNINLDFKTLSKNIYEGSGGIGVAALKSLNLSPGIYLLAGFYTNRAAGHCVVLEVLEASVWVHEYDTEGGLENLGWLRELTYVRRIKLVDEEKNLNRPGCRHSLVARIYNYL